MKVFFTVLFLFTLSFAAQANEPAKPNMAFVFTGNAAKCAAAIGMAGFSFILMGGTQGVAVLKDAINSATRGNVYLHASNCAAIKNKNYLQALMYAGCIVPVNEVDFNEDLVKYNASLADPSCME